MKIKFLFNNQDQSGFFIGEIPDENKLGKYLGPPSTCQLCFINSLRPVTAVSHSMVMNGRKSRVVYKTSPKWVLEVTWW
jgi:hypothetical protein